MGLENLKSIFSEGAGANTSIIGGRHGGIEGTNPPHPDEHTVFDDFQHRPGYGPGLTNQDTLGPSAFENMTQAEYSPLLLGNIGNPVDFMSTPFASPIVGGFTTNFDSVDKSRLAVQGDITNMSKPLNLLENFGGNFSDGIFSGPPAIVFGSVFPTTAPSGYPNVPAGVTSDTSPYNDGVGSFGEGINTNFDGLYSPIMAASNQQTFTVNSPVGFNTLVTGNISFQRTPFPDAHMNGFSTDAVNFFGAGYSYSNASNYNGSPPTIPGFNKNFNTSGFSFPDNDIGNSKYIDIVGGYYPESYSSAVAIGNSETLYTVPQTVFGNQFQPNFNIPGHNIGDGITGTTYLNQVSQFQPTGGEIVSGYGINATPESVDFLTSTISGFSLQFNTPGHNESDGSLGISNYINISSNWTPDTTQISAYSPLSGANTNSEYGVTNGTIASTQFITLPEGQGGTPSVTATDNKTEILLTMRSKQFSDDLNTKLYNTYGASSAEGTTGYDWRTKHSIPFQSSTTDYAGGITNINPYMGTKFDNPLISSDTLDYEGGGLFNVTDGFGKYKYGEIGTPRFLTNDVETNALIPEGSIFSSGNMGSTRELGTTVAGDNYTPTGYTGDILTSWTTWSTAAGLTTNTSTPYEWFVSGENADIPNVNPNFTSTARGLSALIPDVANGARSSQFTSYSQTSVVDGVETFDTVRASGRLGDDGGVLNRTSIFSLFSVRRFPFEGTDGGVRQYSYSNAFQNTLPDFPEPDDLTLDPNNFVNFSSNNNSYKTTTYDPRTPVSLFPADASAYNSSITQNPYQGTKFDDSLVAPNAEAETGASIAGSLWDDSYSNVFRTINTPGGFGDNTVNTIFTKGNMGSTHDSGNTPATPGTPFNPTGYIDLQSIYGTWYTATQGSPPSKYFENGDINNVGWFHSGQDASIPNLNDNVTTTTTDNSFGSPDGGLETRTIQVDASTLSGKTLEDMHAAQFEHLYGEGDHLYGLDNPRLSIRFSNSSGIGTPGFSRAFMGTGAPEQGTGEPYVVSPISNPGESSTFGSSRFFPGERGPKDTERISRFIQSEKGLAFLGTQTALGWGAYINHLAGGFFDSGNFGMAIGLGSQRFNWGPVWGGGLLGSLASSAFSGAGGMTPGVKIRLASAWPFTAFGFGTYEKPLPSVNGNRKYGGERAPWFETTQGGNPMVNVNSSVDLRRRLSQLLDNLPGSAQTAFETLQNASPIGKGDLFTTAPVISDKINPVKNPTQSSVQEALDLNVNEEKHGMPFYFKDLRDGATIYFRAYLAGVSENINPSWSSDNYIGRSEPVYTYERAERNVSFSFKVYAMNPKELDAIYIKIERLSALCYPEYKSDKHLAFDNNVALSKVRMKPPLAEFRMGELFGNNTKNLQGFIKSINFNYPDSSPWEHKKGKRVPKFVEVNIDYQVIHDKTPGIFIEKEGDDYKSTHLTGMHGYSHDTTGASAAPLHTIKLG